MTNYYPMLAEARRNVMLKEYLDVSLKQAGFIDMTIEKTPLGTRLNVLALRPGLVIGPHGSSIRALMEDISKEISLKDITVNAMEIQNPAIDPKAIAMRLSNALQKGVAFRRAVTGVINEAINAGAIGIEVKLQGKIRSERAAFQKFTEGVLPKSGFPREFYTRTAVEHVLMKMGLYGVKVTVAYKYQPEFRIKKEEEKNESDKGNKVE
ncbi:MAG: 30S ribosomal protein S3 [Conexivisphaerales archaeon]